MSDKELDALEHDLRAGFHDTKEAADAIKALRAENARLRALLLRYRNETPLGHQPHMIAHEADAALERNPTIYNDCEEGPDYRRATSEDYEESSALEGK